MTTGRCLAATVLLVVAYRPAFADSLAITPPKVDFGAQPVHSDGQPSTVTLSNQADQPIEISEIIASGIDFVASHDCQTELAPGERCSIQIRFRPVVAGERIGILEILASDSPNPHFVPLSGKASE